MNAGQTLALYEIIRPLGKGGLGEVYLAEDTKLKREAGLKFLPEAFRSESESLRRFRVEAEAAAKLNHPNIAKIYSIKEADDQTSIPYHSKNPFEEETGGPVQKEHGDETR
jgi:eukaryotic-like serine/threonine-protein kinase